MLCYHPDRTFAMKPEDQQKALEITKQLNAAYQCLSDPDARRVYDATFPANATAYFSVARRSMFAGTNRRYAPSSPPDFVIPPVIKKVLIESIFITINLTSFLILFDVLYRSAQYTGITASVSIDITRKRAADISIPVGFFNWLMRKHLNHSIFYAGPQAYIGTVIKTGQWLDRTVSNPLCRSALFTMIPLLYGTKWTYPEFENPDATYAGPISCLILLLTLLDFILRMRGMGLAKTGACALSRGVTSAAHYFFATPAAENAAHATSQAPRPQPGMSV